MGTPISAPSTMTAVALRSAFFHAPGSSGAAAMKSMIRSSAATSRGSAIALASGMKISAEPKPEKPARRSRDEGDRADRDRRVEADFSRNERRRVHAASCRKVPPVFFVTSATIFAATASISWSVRVFSRGWIVTAIAIDFLSGSMPLPS